MIDIFSKIKGSTRSLKHSKKLKILTTYIFILVKYWFKHYLFFGKMKNPNITFLDESCYNRASHAIWESTTLWKVRTLIQLSLLLHLRICCYIFLFFLYYIALNLLWSWWVSWIFVVIKFGYFMFQPFFMCVRSIILILSCKILNVSTFFFVNNVTIIDNISLVSPTTTKIKNWTELL